MKNSALSLYDLQVEGHFNKSQLLQSPKYLDFSSLISADNANIQMICLDSLSYFLNSTIDYTQNELYFVLQHTSKSRHFF